MNKYFLTIVADHMSLSVGLRGADIINSREVMAEMAADRPPHSLTTRYEGGNVNKLPIWDIGQTGRTDTPGYPLQMNRRG